MLRKIAQFATVVGAFCTVGAIGAGCLDRPVTSNGATTKTNFTASVEQNAIDKVDILFDIDNSASMGDKEIYLAKAVPDLVTRLVQPNCVMTNVSTGVQTIVGQSSNGMCASGTIEFPPVHNMHIGVISSSLGTRGGDVCPPSAVAEPFPGGKTLPAHNDDHAWLLNRSSTDVYTETTSPDVGGQNFLDWFPMVAANAGKTATNNVPQALSPQATAINTAAQLEADFAGLIVGSHYYGCGIESQLESWYRFLIQPDPYQSIVVDSKGLAEWSAVDTTILKQRHDFLRPDSLVAIIDLTDENDSEIDVRSISAQAYKFHQGGWTPPRGTTACATAPSSPACQSCLASGASGDPNCKGGAPADEYSAVDDPGFYVNVRHVHMQQKYGLDPQFPIGRYVLGLTSKRVPDRFHEYPGAPGATGYYQGGTQFSGGKPVDAQNLSCANPLFAAKLPDGSDTSVTTLCNASDPGSTRTPDLIFYAHIGGVPHELLQSTPGDGVCPKGTAQQDCPQKDALTPSDWKNILGTGWETLPSPAYAPNPNQYNYLGINPHMVEGFEPRPGLVPLTTGPNPMGGGPDPINGGEWVTDGTAPQHNLPVDREYACIFQLVDPSSGVPTPRDCSMASSDYSISDACDCAPPMGGGELALDAVPAVCGTMNGSTYAKGTNPYFKQYYAKAYPTIREIELVELMGAQGILSSLCPIHVADQAGGSDPLFGYRPAITAIVNRLKNALATQCLPEQLTPTDVPVAGGGTAKEVPCLILATLADNANNTVDKTSMVCQNPQAGLSVPSGDNVQIVKAFQASQTATWKAAGGAGTDPATIATCIVNQLPWNSVGTCATSKSGEAGWCYVTDSHFTGQCHQAIQFTSGSPPQGSVVSLQCIEAAANFLGVDAGAD